MQFLQRRIAHGLLGAIGLALLQLAHAQVPPDEPAERIEALTEYLASVADRRWADALAPAQRMVELARSEAKTRPLALAEALTRLGSVQLALRDFPNAEQNFIEAIVLRERGEGSLDRELEEPLRGLGFTLAATDRHAEAVPVLERAILVNQRYNGLFDLSQQDLRVQLARSFTELGNGPAAEQHVRNLQRAAEQAYGIDDARLAPTLGMIAEWYAHEMGHFLTARSLYAQAIALLEKHRGPNDPGLVNLLRSDARSYTRELLFANAGIPVPASDGSIARPLRRTRLPEEGEQSLLRALRVLEANNREPGAAYVETLIQAGDWYLLKDDLREARKYYKQALDNANYADTAAGGTPLSYPDLIHYPIPPAARRFSSRPADRVDEHYVLVELTVTREGKVTDAEVVESDGTERMVRETMSALREAVFRPRYENGEPVDTPGVRHRQPFRELK